MALVRRYDGEFPQKYFKETIEYMGLSEERFHEIVDYYRGVSDIRLLGTGWTTEAGIAKLGR